MSIQRPYISFAEVKKKISIPAVLEVLGIADRFVRQGEGLFGVCPLPSHIHSHTPNREQFRINKKAGVWLFHCFSGDCNHGGDVVEFVKAMTGHDNVSVRHWFISHFSHLLQVTERKKLQQENPYVEVGERVTNASLNMTLENIKPLAFRLQLDSSAACLKERGLTAETIHRYGLGLCSRGVLKGYIAIPIYTHRQAAEENPTAYLGRWCNEKYDENAGKPRYRWPTGFPKSRIVYGLREALAGPKMLPLIVVEGPFKVYHLVQVGFPHTVALFGSSLSNEQAEILTETGRPLVLMFDGDQAGQAGMQSAAAKLIHRSFIRTVVLKDKKAPDDLSTEELRRVFSFISPERFCNTGCP